MHNPIQLAIVQSGIFRQLTQAHIFLHTDSIDLSPYWTQWVRFSWHDSFVPPRLDIRYCTVYNTIIAFNAIPIIHGDGVPCQGTRLKGPNHERIVRDQSHFSKEDGIRKVVR